MIFSVHKFSKTHDINGLKVRNYEIKEYIKCQNILEAYRCLRNRVKVS